MPSRLSAISQALIVLVLTSFAGVLAKLALNDVSAVTFIWLQIAIGGALLTAYTFWFKKESIPKNLGWQVWAYIVALGIGNFTIVRVMFMLSLERLSATTHVYLVNFVGIATMLFSVRMLRERPSWMQIIGAVIAILGLKVFFDEIPDASETLGLVYVGIGVVVLALTNNVARKLSIVTKNQLSNNIISTLALWVGGIPVVVYGLLLDTPPAVGSMINWGIIILNAIVSIALTMTVWNFILRTLRSYEASVLAGSTVIYTAVFAIPVLGEFLMIHQIIGIGLMLLGLVMSQFRGLRATDGKLTKTNDE